MTPIELLGSLILFEALSPAELQALVAALIVHSTEPGETIFEQGDVATSIFVIEAGVMEISRHNPSGAETLGRLGPGEYMGELGLITNSPRAFTLNSLTHARVLELPGASLLDLLQSNGALNAAMERSVRRGLAMLDRDDGARGALPSEQTEDLFGHIRAFFHVQLQTQRTSCFTPERDGVRLAPTPHDRAVVLRQGNEGAS
jgi:CRP-like cAMP-binding protein